MKTKIDIQLSLPFEEFEFQMEPEIVKRKIYKPKLLWKDLKDSRGLLQRYLTKDLEKTPSGFPKVKAYKGGFPIGLLQLKDIRKNKIPNVWLSGFEEDFVLEKEWLRWWEFFNQIPPLGGMLSPDFSLRLEMTEHEKKFNIFRKNAIAQKAQSLGFNVIHTLSWAEYASLDYCFEGIEPEGKYAISNIGCRRDPVSRKLFTVGLKEAIRVLNPTGFCLYGYPMDNYFGIDTVVYSNKNLERLHRIKRKIS